MALRKRVMGIEPTYLAWKASVLPLNYTRMTYRGDRIRTCDLLVPNQGALAKLSHTPKGIFFLCLSSCFPVTQELLYPNYPQLSTTFFQLFKFFISNVFQLEFRAVSILHFHDHIGCFFCLSDADTQCFRDSGS